jgi:hypothetical protein
MEGRNLGTCIRTYVHIHSANKGSLVETSVRRSVHRFVVTFAILFSGVISSEKNVTPVALNGRMIMNEWKDVKKVMEAYLICYP